MNKISPIDIRVAVLTFPYMSQVRPLTPRPAVLGSYDSLKPAKVNPHMARIGRLFLRQPKTPIERATSRLPAIIRKGEFFLISCIESLKLLFDRWTAETHWEIYPSRTLQVPSLPHPAFETKRPARFFWHSKPELQKDNYTPSCLIPEMKEEDPEPHTHTRQIIGHAKALLSQKGWLRRGKDGFVYLELSNQYIAELFPLIGDEQCQAIPLFYIDPSPAHVPVMTPLECQQASRWGEIKELGMPFVFEIQGCYAVKPKRWPGIEKVYFLTLKSPQLELLREKYLLPKRIFAQDFHIAIGMKRSKEKAEQEPEIFRLNVSCFAA